jgi:predicted GTPase
MSKNLVQVFLKMDVERIFKNYKTARREMDQFIALIPVGAKIVGVVEFMEKMNFTPPQYYRRVNNPGLWTDDELDQVRKIFKEYL